MQVITSVFFPTLMFHSSSVTTHQVCWTLSPHSLCTPWSKAGCLLAGLPQVNGSGLGREGRSGEQSGVRKQNWELNLSQRPSCQGEDGPRGSTAAFFL